MSKLTSILFLFFSCVCFSQTQKLIHGKVSYQNSYQKNVDVINFNTKKLTQTNPLGEFDIAANSGDVLIFMSDNFADQKYTLTEKDFERGGLIIKLVDKPVPLEEVEITQVKALKIEATSYNGRKMAELERQQSNPVNKDVYTGEIAMGMDFVQIGKMIGKLFKSKDQKDRKVKETMTFTDYAKANFNQSFFTDTLKLKPEQISRFIEFCQADPKSKTLVQENDELAILEFLLAKKTEFDKLK